MADEKDSTQMYKAAEQSKCHNEGSQLLEGHNHFKHSTLQFCIYFCIQFALEKTTITKKDKLCCFIHVLPLKRDCGHIDIQLMMI